MPSSSVWIATGSIVKDIGSMQAIKPYLVAGAGSISIDQGSGREAHLDLAAGAGLAFRRSAACDRSLKDDFIRQ